MTTKRKREVEEEIIEAAPLPTDEQDQQEVDAIMMSGSDEGESDSDFSHSDDDPDSEEEDGVEDETAKEISKLLGSGAAEGVSSSTQGSYKKALRSFSNKAEKDLRGVASGSPKHQLAFLRWGTKWCQERARGYSHVEKVYYALQYKANKKGDDESWVFTQHHKMLRWLRGKRLAQKRSPKALAATNAKVVFPAQFIEALIMQCKKDGMPHQALIFHVLFVGSFRHEHVPYFLKQDVFINHQSDQPAELWIGGLKTEGAMEKGGWLRLVNVNKMELQQYINQLPNNYSSLFPSYSSSYTLAYLKEFADKSGFPLATGLNVHAFRGSGAQYLESLNWSEKQVYRHCRWTPNSTVAGSKYMSSVEPALRQTLQEWMPQPFGGSVMKRRRNFTREESKKVQEALQECLTEVQAMNKLQFHAYRIKTYASMGRTSGESGALPPAAPEVLSPASTASGPQDPSSVAPKPQFDRPDDLMMPAERAWVGATVEEREGLPVQPKNIKEIRAFYDNLKEKKDEDVQEAAVEGSEPKDKVKKKKDQEFIAVPAARALPAICVVCDVRVLLQGSVCSRCGKPAHRRDCMHYGVCKGCRDNEKSSK